MHGVVATFKVDPSRPCNTSYQRFLPTGPIAMLPVNIYPYLFLILESNLNKMKG